MTPDEKAARKREYDRTYFQEHRERHNALGKAWRDANLEKARANACATSLIRYHADLEKARDKGRKDQALSYARGRRQSLDTLRRAWLKSRFGFTPDDWQALLDSQGGLCGICRRAQGAKRFAIDHDHATGLIRGLLCDACNRQVGRVEALRSGKYAVHEEWIDRERPTLGSVRYAAPNGWDRSSNPQPKRPHGRPRLTKEVCHVRSG